MMNSWDAEFAADIDTAREVCAGECGLALTDIRLLGEGWDNVVYLVNKELVFRFPRREAAVGCLLAELDLAPLVRTALSIPAIRYGGRKSRVTGRPFAAYDHVPGKPAGELALGAAEKEKLVRPVAKFLRELHATRLPLALAGKWSGNQAWRTDVPGRIALAEKMFLKCADLGVDFGFDLKKIKPLLAKVRFPAERALVHGDLYQLHIIVDADRGPAGIIDWGDVHYGSPCLDLAIAFGYFPKELLPVFEAEYGELGAGLRRASAFRAFCHGLSLLAFAADRGKPLLKEQALASVLTGKTWLEELG